ncbi:MAG: GLUG motif-containing protein [Cloacibacillus sp.]
MNIQEIGGKTMSEYIRSAQSKLSKAPAALAHNMGGGKRLNIFVLAALIAAISFTPFIMMRSFAAQNAPKFVVAPSEVTIFAERKANGVVISADAQTMRLTVTAFPKGEELKWESSNNNIVAVKSGDITAIAPGAATITVESGDLLATCKVKVVAAPTENWAASADISWYDENKTAFTITTAEQFAGVAALVNSGSDDFKGDTITLSKDIDLSAREWTAIGIADDNKRFKGIFDGGGHAVTGLYIKDKSDREGLFAIIRSSAVVKNLRLSGCVASESLVGGVVGQSELGAKITNCSMTGTVTCTKEYVGGVTSYNDAGTVTNCSMTGSVTDDGSVFQQQGAYDQGATGGVVGYNGGTGTVTNCAMNGSVAGGHRAGGVVGHNSGNVDTVANSAMTGSVVGSVIGDPSVVGGVAGKSNGKLINCGWLDQTGLPACGEENDGESYNVVSFTAADTPVTTLLLDNYDLKAAVKTTASVTVRICPGTSAELSAVVSPDIATIGAFERSGDVMTVRITGTSAGSADVKISALVANGAKNYNAEVTARLTVRPGPSEPPIDPPEPSIDPPTPPAPAPERGSSNGCSAGAGGLAMLALAAAAMRARKIKR